MTSAIHSNRDPSGQPLPLWKNRDYVLLWCGQGVSLVGNRASTVAFPLLILAVSHSLAQAGLLGFTTTVPYVLLSLPAGALVDRWNRKTVMIVCDIGRAVAMAGIPIAVWTGTLSLPLLYAVAAVEGTLFVFFDLAEVAALPRVVGKEKLPAASAQNTVMFVLASLSGPPLGGALYQSFGRAFPFVADAVSYAASVLSLLAIKTRFQADRLASRRPLRVEIREGLRWLWIQPLLRFLAFLAFGFNIVFFSAGNILILIVLARTHHAAPSGIGLILAIGSLGGLVGALVVARVRNRFRFGQIMVGTGWLLVALYPLYLAAPNIAALGLIAASLSAVGTVYNVVQYSYRLALTPDELQGRVNSVFRLIAFSGQPIGAALAGLSLQVVGATATVLLVTLCLLTMAAASTLNGHVRRADITGHERVA